jgi:hypothetical protein
MMYGDQRICALRFAVGDIVVEHHVFKGIRFEANRRGKIIALQHNEGQRTWYMPIIKFLDNTKCMCNPKYIRVIKSIDGRIPIDGFIPCDPYYNIEYVNGGNEKLNIMLSNGDVIAMDASSYDAAL